jgi:hypothetical protein
MSTLDQIYGAVLQDITETATLINPIAAIQQELKAVAREPSPGAMFGELLLVFGLLNNATYGLAALQAQLATLTALVSLDNTAILTALGTPQQAGSPVTLAGTFDQEVCDAVWNDIPTSYPRNMGYALVNAAQSAVQANYFGTPPRFGHFTINSIDFPTNDFQIPAYTLPVFDPTDLLVGDTLLSMMIRQNPTATVVYGNPPQTNVTIEYAGGTGIGWITDLDETSFSQMKAFLYPSSFAQNAPVWPGLANVTLLTPVALDVTLTVTEAMNGAIIDITSVPIKQGFFTFGDLISWRNVGALAFVDDNGQAEYPQLLGLASAVYLPKAMVHASGVVVRASPGVTGTITPFTIN